MERRSAPAAGAALEARGRAQRFACAGGELWRLPSSDSAVGERLLALGAEGVGGFVEGGIDEDGVWLVRRRGETLGSHKRWEVQRALAVATDLARALAACEARSLFAGAAIPSAVALGSERAWLVADALVGAMVGHGDGALRGSETRPGDLLWAPPEAIDDGRWDSAANRYALGVMLYEMLAGAHPFGGAGLRHALAEARSHEAAPFAEEVARELPPGLQSLVLRMIAIEPAERPRSAQEIVERLADPGRASPRRARPSSAAPAAPAPKRKAARELDLAWLLGKLRWAPAAVGVVLFGLAVAWALDAPSKPAPAPLAMTPARALDAAHLRARDCASCHPSHSAEWSQSVMGHAVKSPLFNALEALIEEQVGRDRDCPGGAGILRRAPASPAEACRDLNTGRTVTGSGGEHWCINCHSPGDNIASRMPAWSNQVAQRRLPVRDLIDPLALEGISCAFCHQVHGPVGPNGSGGYQGNPSWTSFLTGNVFLSRPEDGRGLTGIANSGYRLDPAELLGASQERVAVTSSGFVAHARPTEEARAYLRSSRFCGSCHDVRLFGSDVLGAQRGEHFKRLRNAFSEWVDYAAAERAAGRKAEDCQGCHMSTFPGVCVPGGKRAGDLSDAACPDGMRFEARDGRPSGFVALGSKPSEITPHYFSSVDLPLARDIGDDALDLDGVDVRGVPLSLKRRRDLLLRHSMRLSVGSLSRRGDELEVPLTIENHGGGHKVPAGFSQEREIWVHLRVEDGAGRTVYEVGRVERNDEDLRDKVFLRVNTDPDRIDFAGRPLGLFGADVQDGPEHPEWSPRPERGGSDFRGRGLINFQNGFLRCVRCLGAIGADGECLARPFDRHRAERYDDGDYDLDTGECRSNLFGSAALFETYFPVGALDAERGIVKGPDAIIDTRSLPPKQPKRYTYVLPLRGARGPFHVVARLMFRSFPPFLVRAFADYEARQARRGLRPSGALVSVDMMARLERVEVARVEASLPDGR
jgi:hypothetical protein